MPRRHFNGLSPYLCKAEASVKGRAARRPKGPGSSGTGGRGRRAAQGASGAPRFGGGQKRVSRPTRAFSGAADTRPGAENAPGGLLVASAL
jgi:hypothetical protein